MADPDAVVPATKELILASALQRFSEQGFASTSLNDIADDVGIRRPSLLHHFPSKDALYRAVLQMLLLDWLKLVEQAAAGTERGWPKVERMLLAAFTFFEEHPEFVRLARREAIDGGPALPEELAAALTPLFDQAVGFLEKEMRAGRLRRHNPRQLIITGYGAILSYFSDAPLITALLGGDPASEPYLTERRRHLIRFFRHALGPDS